MPTDQQASEDDWSLPAWVKPTKTSGISFYSHPPAAYPGELTELYTFRWKDVNPTEDVYNWSGLQKELARGVKIITRMEVSDSIHVPQWLFSKYPDLQSKVFLSSPYDDNFEVNSPGRFIPLWHPGVEAMLDSLLKSFKRNDFAGNVNYHSAYYPGAWEWGEYARPDYAILEAQGLTPDTYVAWMKRMIDAYVDAYNGRQNKLIFTGGDLLENFGSTLWRDAVGRQPTAYAIAQGTGARTGLLEKFNFMMTDIPNYGTSVLTIGTKNYMVTDDNNLLLSDTMRVWANENEEFCYNSPDAWCALREAKDVYQWWANYPSRKDFFISNFERWLYQREVSPEGITQRTYLNMDDAANGRLFNDYSYEARSTIHANGADYIYFNVDDQFINGGINNVQVKITYLDNFTGSWQLQYDAASSVTKEVDVTNNNDGAWKTITLTLADAKFANRQNNGNDFRIYNGGTNDIQVRFVRVVKLTEPIATGIVQTIKNGNMLLYPNPASSQLTVDNLDVGSEVSVARMDGTLVSIETTICNVITFDVSSWAKGLYLIYIRSGSETVVKKAVIQ